MPYHNKIKGDAKTYKNIFSQFIVLPRLYYSANAAAVVFFYNNLDCLIDLTLNAFAYFVASDALLCYM